MSLLVLESNLPRREMGLQQLSYSNQWLYGLSHAACIHQGLCAFVFVNLCGRAFSVKRCASTHMSGSLKLLLLMPAYCVMSLYVACCARASLVAALTWSRVAHVSPLALKSASVIAGVA